MRPGRKIKQPPEKTHSYYLWLILGGRDGNLTEAAKKTGFGRQKLHTLICDTCTNPKAVYFSGDFLTKIQHSYPETWALHGENLRESINALPEHRHKPRPNRRLQEPKHQDSFGYSLWNVLDEGEKKFKITDLGAALGIKPCSLTGVLHGRLSVSQGLFFDNSWPKVLNTQNPEGWQKHGPKLLSLLESSRIASVMPKTPTPEIPFVKVFLELIGPLDKRGSRTIWAKRLNISAQNLSNFIHEKCLFSQKYIDSKGWRAVFAQHIPEKWEQHKDAFEEAYKQLTPACGKHDRSKQKKRVKVIASDSWRRSAANFVAKLMDDRDDKPEHIKPYLNGSAATLDSVLTASTTITLERFRATVVDVCTAYEMNLWPPTTDQEVAAYRLLSSKPRDAVSKITPPRPK